MTWTDDILVPLRKWNYAIPRAEYHDWYMTVLLYELYGEKDALEVGAFTGANTLFLSYIAKIKGKIVYAIDNWDQAKKANVSPIRAKELFYAHLNLLDTKESCRLLEIDAIDIADEYINKVDFIFYDINSFSLSCSPTSQVLNFINKIKRKTIFILDDYEKSNRNLDIDQIVNYPNVEEIYRTKSRSYMTIFHNKETIEKMKNFIEELL